MMKFIYWAIGVRDREPTNSINPNSMSPIPKNKFVNYARAVEPNDDDDVPHQTIYHLKRMERIYGKSIKRKKQQADYNKWYDYFNH
jgi:hypothetical protein